MALVPCQVLRVAILLSYCSILCNYKAIEMPSHQTYGGSWKFLTFIDLVIQAVFFGICVLTDLSSLLTRGSGSQEQERQLKKLISLRDWMLAVVAFPVGVFVVAVFWIIYAYDREMIYPKLLDNFIPGWLNHGMGVLGAPCHWHVGVPFPGTHRPGSQNHLLWVYNHLNEFSVPSGRSSEQLHLGYTEKYGRREREAQVGMRSRSKREHWIEPPLKTPPSPALGIGSA
ncbi:androgen-induced gene 1 protein isoform X3 [Oryctolagus cuniculus]|uniref:androgen-induced gene 1 protein isoform X3 n=1 Tax=Oryctolagus cuniculus TaxID=9986 RepID=UPI0007EE2F08|nr:androgen-induced gene 1 protein isoform X2 [Oryctolagus cuniculus]